MPDGPLAPASLTARAMAWLRDLDWRARRGLNDAQRELRNVFWRRVLAGMAATLVTALRGRRFTRAVPAAREQAQVLSRRGVLPLGPLLDPRQIEEVCRFVQPHPCRDPYLRGAAPFLADAPPPDANLGAYEAPLVAQAPHLLRVANDPRILAVVERFLGAPPTISGLHLWWSFADRVARQTQMFHRDRDDLRFCKLFIYLTDVDLQGGPHVVVAGSARVNRCVQARRHSDEEVEQAFAGHPFIHVCGQRGDAFLVDTSGVHKGLAPRACTRLVFVAQYSLFSVPSRRYRPVLSAATVPGLDRYVNRLFIA
jgi:hypothetical protein